MYFYSINSIFKWAIKAVLISKITSFLDIAYKKSNSLSMNNSPLFAVKYGNFTDTSLG